MLWGVLFVAILIIGFCMESKVGRIIVSLGVVALGMLLLSLLTGWDFFVLLAQLCAIIIVVVIVGVIVMSILGSGKE